VEEIVDATGLLCPLPLIRAQEFARSANPGTTFIVHATDPGVFQDFPAWCRMHGHTLVDIVEHKTKQIIEVTIELSS